MCSPVWKGSLKPKPARGWSTADFWLEALFGMASLAEKRSQGALEVGISLTTGTKPLSGVLHIHPTHPD